MELFRILTLLLLVAESAKGQPIFGTESGYDAGGEDAICFSSQLNPRNDSSPIFGTSLDAGNGNAVFEQESLQDINQDLFEGDSQEFKLLPSCFEGTKLSVEPLDVKPDGKLETGTSYTFRVKLEVLLSKINENIPQIEESTIYVRLILCDAVTQGFCNPLQDTRDIDDSLRPSQSDLNATEADEFDEGLNRWHYDEGDVLLGLVQGPIVLSRWCKWRLKEVEEGSDLHTTKIDITFQLPPGVKEGPYFVVSHVVMNFDTGGGLVERLDVADAIPDNILEVRAPPTILRVSESMKIVVAMATGVIGSYALYCFAFVIYHRHHVVMRLAQAPFLAMLAGCCLVSIAFSFTLLPIQDVFCAMKGPLTLIPLTTAGAILVARIWRVYMTLSVALTIGRSRRLQKHKHAALGKKLMDGLGILAHLPLAFTNLFKKKTVMTTRASRLSLRQAVGAEETISLIAILSFPQFFLQIFASVYFDLDVELEFDGDANIGRWVCSNSEAWVSFVGMTLTAAVFALGVVVAWIARQLPSAFNEKDQVFQTAMVNLFIAVIAVTLAAITNQPTTSPDVDVFLGTMFSIGTAIVILVVMVRPKIRRVRSGDKVVMSQILGANFAGSSISSSRATEPIPATSPYPDQDPTSRFRSRIIIEKDDPLPRELETGILETEELLREVTKNIGEGRALTLEDWKQLRADVAKLHDSLGQIDLAWTDDDAEVDTDTTGATLITPTPMPIADVENAPTAVKDDSQSSDNKPVV